MSSARVAALAAALVAGGLGYFSRFSEAIPNPNEVSRMYLTMALVDHRTVAIDQPMRRHGVVLDHALRRGHRYSDKAPGMSLLAVPLYAAARSWIHGAGDAHVLSRLHRVMRWGLTIVPTALFCALCTLVLAPWVPDARLRLLLVLAYVFATPARYYGDLVFGHQTAGLFAATALFAATRDDDRWVALSGLLAGATFMIEYLGVVVVPGVALYLLLSRRARALLPFAEGAVVPVLVTLVYHHVAFGSPFTPGYGALATGFAAVHATGVFGVRWPTVEGALGLTFSLARGLFVSAPWLLASIPGAWWLARDPRRRPLLIATLVVVIGWWAMASGFAFWHGGGAPGPRHIVATLPLMAALTGPLFSRDRPALERQVLSGAIVYSAIVTSVVSATYFFFSPDIAHPYRDLTLPLLERGVVTPNVLTALGVGGAWSVAPYALFTASLCALALLALDRGRVVARALGAVALVVLLFTAGPAARGVSGPELDELIGELEGGTHALRRPPVHFVRGAVARGEPPPVAHRLHFSASWRSNANCSTCRCWPRWAGCGSRPRPAEVAATNRPPGRSRWPSRSRTSTRRPRCRSSRWAIAATGCRTAARASSPRPTRA